VDAINHNSIRESLDHLFRQHAGQMVSILSHIFGLRNLDMIEDAVQDSLVTAMKTWSYAGIPDNPRAWLVQVSKNRILDRLRYDKRFQNVDETQDQLDHALKVFDSHDSIYFASEMGEDQLRMIFACCHPAIPPDSRVALTLKIIGGFRVSEIARAFLASDESIAKMLTRARHRLRSENIVLEIPPPSDVPSRIDTVLKVIYLMFNEGYAASEGEELIRRDLCHEAIRLSELLAEHPITTSPAVHALTALLLFQASRLDSRCRSDGELLLLSEQDRAQWDNQMINRAFHHFMGSASGDELSDYHLEAEIAACHATAKSYDDTRWEQIHKCYELLQCRKFSPVVELNRIIVLARIEGAAKGLEELGKIQENEKLKDYNLFHITRASFLSEIGRNNEAADCYKKAINLTQNETVKRFLCGKMNSLMGH
jgi:RNA polymerase sigma factor (sigma-70 family)